MLSGKIRLKIKFTFLSMLIFSILLAGCTNAGQTEKKILTIWSQLLGLEI